KTPLEGFGTKSIEIPENAYAARRQSCPKASARSGSGWRDSFGSDRAEPASGTKTAIKVSNTPIKLGMNKLARMTNISASPTSTRGKNSTFDIAYLPVAILIQLQCANRLEALIGYKCLGHVAATALPVTAARLGGVKCRFGRQHSCH